MYSLPLPKPLRNQPRSLSAGKAEGKRGKGRTSGRSLSAILPSVKQEKKIDKNENTNTEESLSTIDPAETG